MDVGAGTGPLVPGDSADGSPDLVDFVASVAGEGVIRVEEDLGAGFVRLSTSEAERRQARHDIRSVEDLVIELLRNSRDAGASTIVIGTQKDASGLRTLTVIDDGSGIPESMHKSVFLPRVTSKLDSLVEDEYGVHGRGMALYSISQNTVESGIAFSRAGEGTAICVFIDTQQVHERKDQSTLPTLRHVDGAREVVRGPRNIARTLVEFALLHPELTIYLGSPSEALSTLFFKSRTERSWDVSVRPGAPWRLVDSVEDSAMLHRVSRERLGLLLSVRNSHRVLCGEVPPLQPLLARAVSGVESASVDEGDSIEESAGGASGEAPQAPPADHATPGKGSRIVPSLSRDDSQDLSRLLSEAVEAVTSRYFVRVGGEPKVSFTGDSVKITLPLYKDE